MWVNFDHLSRSATGKSGFSAADILHRASPVRIAE
jgi:hypothetical protein